MLRLALAQLDLTVGALAENRKRIADACADAARAGAELVLAPELAISGYPPEDLLLRPAFLRACQAEAELLAAEVEVPLVVGCPWLDGDRVRNSALVLASGEILARYDKRELPNYGVFDEERTFSPGRGSLHIETPGGRARADGLRGRLAARRRRRGGRARSEPACSTSRPRRTTSARARRARRCSRRAPATASARWPTAISSAARTSSCSTAAARSSGPTAAVLARAASFAEELLVCDLDLDASRAGAAARLAPAPGPPPSRASAGDDRAPARRRARAARAVDRAAAGGQDRRAVGRAAPRASATTCARTASSGCCSASRAGSTRRSWPRSPPTRSAPTGSRPSRCRRATTARARAATRASSPSGSASRSASSRSRICGWRSRGRCPGTSGLAAENLQARIRGVLLMTLSNQHGWLVLTTGNKSETAVGYSTLYGDSAGGFAPIKDVPKTLVFALSRYVNERAGQRADPRLDHRAPAVGGAARRPARRPVAAALRASSTR